MRNPMISVAVAAVVMCAGAMGSTRAEAATFGSTSGLAAVADVVAVTQNAQYVRGGRRYCWYANGWQGPGWYWCGYRSRHGLGWGGPAGWNSWVYGAPVVVAPRAVAPVVVVPRRPPPRRRGPVVIVR